jgi:hypothetical protein
MEQSLLSGEMNSVDLNSTYYYNQDTSYIVVQEPSCVDLLINKPDDYMLINKPDDYMLISEPNVVTTNETKHSPWSVLLNDIKLLFLQTYYRLPTTIEAIEYFYLFYDQIMNNVKKLPEYYKDYQHYPQFVFESTNKVTANLHDWWSQPENNNDA